MKKLPWSRKVRQRTRHRRTLTEARLRPRRTTLSLGPLVRQLVDTNGSTSFGVGGAADLS